MRPYYTRLPETSYVSPDLINSRERTTLLASIRICVTGCYRMSKPPCLPSAIRFMFLIPIIITISVTLSKLSILSKNCILKKKTEQHYRKIPSTASRSFFRMRYRTSIPTPLSKITHSLYREEFTACNYTTAEIHRIKQKPNKIGPLLTFTQRELGF